MTPLAEYTVVGNIAPDVIPPWFEEDWDYTNTADMTSDPNGWLAFSYGTSHISHGTDGSAPWGGGGGYCRGQYGPSGNDSGVVNVTPPDYATDQLGEWWWEGYIRFSSNWDTDWPGGETDDHKTVLWFPDPESGSTRISLKVGVFASAEINAYFSGGTDLIGSGDDGLTLETDVWDGQWHRWRAHIKIPSDGGSDGIMEIWFDDTQLCSVTNASDPGGYSDGDYLRVLALGRNTNNDATEDMELDFGRQRLWDTDPGW